MARPRRAWPRWSWWTAGADEGAGHADRVAEGDGAAVDVGPFEADLQLAVAGEDLGGERLVDLDHVDLGRPSRACPAASGRPGPPPSPMKPGSTPALAQPAILASGRMPPRAVSSAITTRAAAPSGIPEEFRR